MKIFKRLTLILTATAATFIATLLFVAANIDPNDYKKKIEAAVEQATGRKLHIAGNIELKLFPTLNLDLEHVSIDNPAGFEGRFVSVERILAGLHLLPLLQKRLEIGKITLHKPELALRTLADGRTNWEVPATKSAEAPPRQPADAKPDEIFAIAGFSLAGVSVEKASVIWRDARTREHIRADAVTLKTGALASGKPTKFSLSGTVSDKRRGLSADLNLNTTVLVDLPHRHVHLEKLDSRLQLNREGAKPLNVGVNTDAMIDLANRRVHLKKLDSELQLNRDGAKPLNVGVNADAAIDLAKDTGTFSKLLVAVDNIRIEGDGSVTGMLSNNPRVDAKLGSNAFDLRTFADKFDLPLPNTADDSAFHRFAASGDFTAHFGTGKSSATIHRSEVTLDDSRLRVQGDLAWSPSLHITLDGELDRINAGRYLPPDNTSRKSSGKMKNIHVADLRARISTDNRKTSVSVPAAKIFGGDFNGKISVDNGAGTDGTQPKWRSSGKLSDAKIGQVLAALGMEDDKSLKGAGTLSYKLTAVGDDEKTLARSLAGSVKLALAKGAFKNPGLSRNIERAVAFLEKRPARNAGRELIFNRVNATFSLNNGIADNRNLEVDMPLLHIRGAGRLDLVRSRIDHQLRAGLLRQKPEERIYIPIKISGKLDDLKYSIDFEQALQEEAGRRLDRETKKAKRKLKKKIKEKKDVLKEKVGEKINEILKDALKLPF